MKKQIFLLGLSICCFAASAQPTSFGGITPGTTTREELKSLLQDPDVVDAKGFLIGSLKQPEGKSAWVSLQNDVVYKVETGLHPPELKQVLIKKYGQPKIKVGAIRTVNCQNKFGASFERFDGEETLLWPVKDGVQGGIRRLAGRCADDISEMYVLRYVATVKAIEKELEEKESKESEEKRRKLDGAL